jgi:hypothetical protein
VGHAPTVGGANGLLERSGRKSLHFRILEDDYFVFYVVYLKGMQCSKI